MPKYTDEAGAVIDTGDVTIQEIQTEAERLRGHNTTLLGEKRSESDKRRQAEERVNALTTELDTTKASLSTREAEITAQFEEKVTKATSTAEALKTTLLKLAVDTPALKIASEQFTAPDLALPHIKSRLTAELKDNGEIAVVVLDAAGKPTAGTLEDLMKEMAGDARFAPIVKGSKAQGGGNGKPAVGTGNKPTDLKSRVEARKAARANS